jgi:hypothetical protein
MHQRSRYSVRFLLFALMAAVLSITAIPVSPVGAAGPITRLIAADQDPVGKYMYRYERVTLDPTAAASKVGSTGVLSFQAGYEAFDIELEQHDLRAPGYVAQETLEDGTTRVLPSAPVTTYAGRVLNREGAYARFTIEGETLVGLIIDGEEHFFIEPLLNYTLSAKPTDYVFYRESDLKPEAFPGTCDVTAAHKVGRAIDGVASKAEESAAVAATYVVQLATEADNEYVTALGSAQAANSEILSIVNQVDGVYQAELGIDFQVVLQNSYAGADPYTNATSSSTILNEFRNRWNSAMTGVARDVAHLWTGKDMDGSTIGIAWVGVVCNAPTYSYGVSQRFTGTPQKYILSAHELGHNFDADHSDGQSGCSNTVMGSSVGNGFSFCTFSRNQITSHVNANSSCLGSGTSPTAPAAPSNLSATAISRTRIDLTWADNSSNETGFRIERSTNGTSYSQIASVGANVSSFSSTGLRRNRLYYFRVRAYNSVGNSNYSNVATARTLNRAGQ